MKDLDFQTTCTYLICFGHMHPLFKHGGERRHAQATRAPLYFTQFTQALRLSGSKMWPSPLGHEAAVSYRSPAVCVLGDQTANQPEPHNVGLQKPNNNKSPFIHDSVKPLHYSRHNRCLLLPTTLRVVYYGSTSAHVSMSSISTCTP